ncbi:unnamed protein product [Coregonus sp. 'balchen']|nr:unnamed protein product [Coregonus sp. 'balchen']
MASNRVYHFVKTLLYPGESIDNIGQKIVYLLAYHVVFILFTWAYWQTIFTKPMNPLKEDRGESQQEILRRIAKDLPIYTRTMSGAIRFCDRCQLVKPDRCHHCSVCDKVNNCVGFSNYKFFMLFLAYSLLYCLFITATDLQYFIKFWTNGLPDTQAKFHIMFLFFAASMFSVSLASLFVYHCWLVCKNRSTLEAVRAPAFRHGADKNGFSLGLIWVMGAPSQPDPEQPTSPGHNPPPNKTVVGESHQFPAKPLRESQSRLLNSTLSWTENGGAADKERLEK